jgi:hypothetical protein
VGWEQQFMLESKKEKAFELGKDVKDDNAHYGCNDGKSNVSNATGCADHRGEP